MPAVLSFPSLQDGVEDTPPAGWQGMEAARVTLSLGKTHGGRVGSNRRVEIFSSTPYLIPSLVQTPPALDQDQQVSGWGIRGDQ